MNSTSKFNKSSIGVPQHGTNWCIPASIENLLRAEGVTDITQEDLLYEYLLSLKLNINSQSGATVPLSSLQRYQALELFRCAPIPNISFQSLGPIGNTVLTQKGKSTRLKDISDIKTSPDYVNHLNNQLSQNKPVLMSAGHASGWHITIVYQIDPTTIWSYDPGQDRHLAEPITSYAFSHDVLFVQ